MKKYVKLFEGTAAVHDEVVRLYNESRNLDKFADGLLEAFSVSLTPYEIKEVIKMIEEKVNTDIEVF